MIDVRQADKNHLPACLAIRYEVFVLAQGIPPQLEQDGEDPYCTHFLAWDRDQAIGTARLRITRKGEAKAERVAVRIGYRGLGVGRALMRAIEQAAAVRGHGEVVLTAQTAVSTFYEKLGYTAEGPVFYEATVPHRKMRKAL